MVPVVNNRIDYRPIGTRLLVCIGKHVDTLYRVHSSQARVREKDSREGHETTLYKYWENRVK